MCRRLWDAALTNWTSCWELTVPRHSTIHKNPINMSWAVEEWKEGLSPGVLQKIHELESQVDKLKKERQQRQFQLEYLEVALQKQKEKVETEKNEAATLKRENQSLMELCDSLEKAKQKISNDLQVKESQVNIQSGRLNSSKKNIKKLEQELKRYKCELERSQQTSIAGDLSFSGTPQKSFTAPLTPIQSHNDAKFEELEEKYKKEVQERKKLELELRTIQVKEINQPCPQSSFSHREIACHQASSSVFSWQQEKTPSKNQETPARGSYTTSSFPWETNSSITSQKNKFNNSFSENCNSSLTIHLTAQNQELSSTVKELEQQLQAQEKVKKSHMNKHQETELQLDRMKLELTKKNKVLSKTREKLTHMGTELDQATTQAQMMEQKVKRLSEELNHQRQNAESACQSLEQKIKEKDKEYQQELSCQQHSLQTLNQQCNQIRNKQNQELEQAKNYFNALQAEFHKVMTAKQHLERNTSDLTQKLCRAEQVLLAAQAKETDLTRSFEEVKQEKNLIDCQLEKKLQEIHQLEEELNTIRQSLKQCPNFAEEMKSKNTCQEAELKLLGEKFEKQESSLSLEKLKIALADMEKQQDSAQDLLKEKDNHIKEQNCKISKMEEETEALQRLLGFKQRECEELQKEATAFSQWKNEKDNLINKLKSEKQSMLTHINDLERSLQSQQIKNHEHSEKLRMVETESDRKSIEIRELKDILECKSAELEEQKKAFGELQWKAECSDKKYCKEIENMSCKIFQLTNQIGELEEKLQLAASEGLQREQCYQDLLGEYEKVCCLVKAKDTSETTEDGEVNLQSGQDKTVLDNTQLAANNSIAEDHGCATALLEVEQTRDLTVLQDQISSLEISLVAQKQLNSNHQQQQYEDLPQIKVETEERLFNVEQMRESFVTETKWHISNLQADISAHQKLVEKTSAVLEEKDTKLQTLNERLENQQAELQDLKIDNKSLEDSVRQLKLVSGTWDSEKKDVSSMICSYSKKTEELTEENGTLKDLSRALEQEQITLVEANKNISDSLKEREEIISEMSGKYKEERQHIESRTEEIKTELKDLQAKYKSVEKENANMMSILREQTIEFENVKAELEIYEVRLSKAADTLDDAEMTKRDCHEQLLPAENEQSSPKSEQVNIENHALFIERDIEMLQAKCQQLEREREVNLKTIFSFQEHLVSVTAERNHIGQELSILSENKKELEQKYQKLQEKFKELESTKMDSTEFIRRLEDEVRTQTNLLETAKSDVYKLSNEKDHLLQKLQSLGNDAVSITLEKLQNEAADLKKEKELIVRELEMIQSKLSSSEMENSKLSRSLEGLLMEKGELAVRLSSAQREVEQMRYGIEKLKAKIESDEKKNRHVAEKLKENERNVDSLLDKIERLDRELEMSEKNLEDAIIQSETAKAETETLTIEREEMTEKLKCFNLQIDVLTSQKECLTKDLKEKQERILELEFSNLTTEKLLEEKEEEKMQIKNEFENTVVLLKSELKDISEKLEISCKEEADARAKEQVLINQVACLEQDKTMLLQECQEIKNENTTLCRTREVLVQELMDFKQKLDEKVQENGAFQKLVKETEELSHMQQQQEYWHQEKKRLQNLIAELKLKEQHSSDNETFPDILNVLKVSYKDLEKELESTRCEKNTLCKKVNELTENHIDLQVKLNDSEQKISKLQEEFTTERNKLAEEIQLHQEHSEKNKIQLHQTMSEKNELTKSLEMVQKELEEKESEMKREISEYRLLQAEKEHQDALTEANQKNEVEIEACHDKMNSLEHFIISQKLEIEHLKSNKEELSNSLKEANQTLGEFLKTKADNINIIVQLKKENEFAHSRAELWMKSCKKMEQEKEMLQKQLDECDELLKKKDLTMSKYKKEGADENAITEEMKLKLEELQKSTEVKTREANENLEKYCSLIVKYYKLEEVNEVLKTQDNLSAQLKQLTSDAVSTPLLNSDSSLTVSNRSVKQMRSDEDTTKLSSKRQRYEDNREDNGKPRSPVPETSSKKKRKNDICQNLLGQENTDNELDGLPEVVKKGFADIPAGKVSPHILRRTTLNQRTSLHATSPSEKLPLPTQDVQKCGPNNLSECSRSTPGGSKPQKVNDEQQSQAITAFPPKKSTSRSPLCPYKQSPNTVSDNSRESHVMHKAKNSLNDQGLPEQDKPPKNCTVQ
ncbi:centromere protein f [Limosa lapponica baueri]|uniref:Centromere protein f n=1 Tax=Limosa lapponica baueri TaxID=1758121 RepID=A0A2I0USA7_LIMLA|nr:centromere protein f [Limosa lapponica baueri]